MPQKEPALSEKQRKTLAACALAIFVLMTLAIAWFVGRPMLRFVSEPARFRAWVDEGGVMSRLWFLGMVLLQAVVAIIPGEPLEMGAGYAFGFLEGTLLCLAGTVLGSMLVFFFVRRFGLRAVEIFFPRARIDSLRFLRNEKKRDALVFLLVLIPGTPKDLLAYFVGLTSMRPLSWLLITAVARIPSIVTSTVGGDALGMKNYAFAAVALGATLAISGLGFCIYRHICKKHEKEHEEDGAHGG